MATETKDLLSCSFCGKSQETVAKLIAGPGVYICDECVGLCRDILEDQPALAGLPDWEQLSTEELLARMVRVAKSRDQVEDFVGHAVRELRRRGMTWAAIGEELGVSRQAAWERYSGEE